jgi:hypothetical protein
VATFSTTTMPQGSDVVMAAYAQATRTTVRLQRT